MNQLQSFSEAVSALQRRALLICVVTFAGCILSLNFALNQARVYEATAVVQIEDARVPDQLMGAANPAEDATRRVRLIEQRLMARDNLVRIMDKHDLFSDDPAMTMNERIFRMREAADIQQIVNRANPYGAGANTPSGLLITVRLSDPDKAATLANELMYTVIDQSRDRSLGRARDTLDFFIAEEARVSSEIEILEGQIATFKRDNADSLPAGLDDLRGQLASLREADLDLDRQILTLETDSSRLRDDVQQRQTALFQEQKRLLAVRMDAILAQIEAAPEAERDLSRLERELTRLQEQYSVVTRRKAEAEMGQVLEDRQQTDRFEVLETALVPESPVSRSRKKLAAMGAVASLVAGLAAAFLAELLNPAIRSAAQLDRALGVQPVVAIPVIETRRDRTRRGLAIFGWIVGLLASAAALLAGLGSRLPMAETLGRFLPRLSAGS
ncbi:chain-length determining protein [Thetidibacter halocola]|uniref:Chain-length determining protein n=1 Tax=Thetidibacter halocola TaxID=2827239 RepID=A0A8J7WE04_9RHOB|nr:chain-length determining protein [Thetidibacter halocola]MBS0123388.1 chain-length determining protein [Thetidibacter halocola]